MTQPANTPPPIAIRPMRDVDHGYVSATWRESFKDSSAQLMRMSWPQYKASVGRELAAIVASATLLGAYEPNGKIVGWLAFTPGRSISAVHYAYTRYRLEDEPWRRRGVMTALLDEAALGRRFVFTHRGVREKTHRGKGERREDATRTAARGPTLDVALVEWLHERGQHAEFCEWREWKR